MPPGMTEQQMSWGLEHESRVATALTNARDSGYAKSGHEIVFEVFKNMAGILSREDRRTFPPVSEKSGLAPSYQNPDLDERNDAIKQRMIDISAGDDPSAVFGIRDNEPDPEELAMVDFVYHVFRLCLFGRFVNRDWRILLCLSRGVSGEKVAEREHMTRFSVSDRKIIQCGAIWRRVCHLMPPEPAGNVLRDAA